MALRSMTGFARSEGQAGALTWAWELRAVNGRGLDLRLRLPPGFESLEPKVREAATRHLSRGSLTINLSAKRTEGVTEMRLNEAVLQQVLVALDAVRARAPGPVAPLQAETLLSLRGVLEARDTMEDEEALQKQQTALLGGLETAFAALVAMRTEEGERLARVLEDQVASVERLVAQVAASPAHSAEAMRQRLKDQVGRLLGDAPALDEGRLYQEAALLATRADVEEELKRLTAHVAAARALLKAREPVGRKLDFLAQEFNREANTLCSKASDRSLTATGLDLKTVIDQMREQVQNIE